MKSLLSYSKYLLLVLIAFAGDCGGDDGPVITPPIVTVNVSNFTTTIDENPTNGQLLGTIEASTNEGSLTFSLSTESPVGAFSINASTGEISVLDSVLFDFETNPTLTAEVTATNGGVSESATITVNLNDISSTISLLDFTTTIDENPANGEVLGTIEASTNDGSLTFSLSTESPVGAFSINASTGEISVLDSILFDFETNPTLTAEVTATNGGVSESATITVNLNDISSTISLLDFTTTIDENPTNGQLLGTIEASTNDGSLTFSLSTESPVGAFSINASTGEISVLDSILFDFETNPILTAEVTATNGEVSESATVTVNLNDISSTISLLDFTTTIDENPANGQVLGTVEASTNDGILTFSLSTESPVSAFSINASTGEISVLDSVLFDFETNPVLTATVTATNGGVTESATITVNLTNLAPTLSDLTVTIAENPINGQSLGTVVGNLSQLAGTTITLTNEASTSGALRLDLLSGEVQVSNSLLFDYETRTSIAGTVTAIGELNATITITITLTNVNIIWNGPTITFTKANFADASDEANWDKITDSVAITRGDFRSIYNPIFQSGPTDGRDTNPTNTLWAIGTTTDLNSLNFINFQNGTERIIGGFYNSDTYTTNFDIANVVLYLPKEDIYIDVEFITWQSGESDKTNNGGGFSYRRATRGVGQ